MATTFNQLQDQCFSIARSLEDSTTFHILHDDALDIEFTINSKGQYLGAEVLVSFGGPTIWVDTRHSVVRGSWWGETWVEPFEDAYDLHDQFREKLDAVCLASPKNYAH